MDIEVVKYLNEKLKLDEYLGEKEFDLFMARFAKYFKGNYSKRSISGVGGRTLETLKKNLDDLSKFLTAIGCEMADIIYVVDEAPDLLNVDINKLYDKYLVLGMLPICEEVTNYRLEHILAKPEDIRTGLDTIYARIMFATEAGYPMEKATWNMNVHATNSEFAAVFVKGAYSKSYKILDSKNAYNEEAVKKLYPITEAKIEELKGLKANKEVVENYEGKGPRVTV